MDSLEQDLRSELSRQVAVTPQLPGLVDAVVRRGRRARRRRAAAGTAGIVALVAAVALVGSTLGGAVTDRRDLQVAAALEGPPRVPLAVLQAPSSELLQWVDGTQTSFPLGELLPIAVVPDGVLLLVPGPALDLLEPGSDASVRLAGELDSDGVAVAPDGRRVTVVRDAQLQELAVPTGQVLRSVPLTRAFEGLRPVTYSGDAVLLALGEGDGQQTLLWEGNDDGVLSAVFDTAVLGGAGTGTPAGRIALRTQDDRCGTEVQGLSDGDGPPWRLCREPFVGFSPDGSYVLATNAVGDALVVRDGDDGEQRRTFRAPQGLRAYGWESEDTLLYTTLDGDRTVVVRCSVEADACRTAASFPFDDRIPQPVRPAR